MASPAVPRTPPPLGMGMGPLALPRPPPGMMGFPGLPPFNPLNMSNDDELNGAEMDSDLGSDNEDSINDIDTERLDESHREILEKLKRQEQEERIEIERELREAQKDALARLRQHEEQPRDREQELRLQDAEKEDRDSEITTQTEIITQRPLGLLAQHGLQMMNKVHAHSAAEKDRDINKDMLIKEKEKMLMEKAMDAAEREKDLIPPPIDFSKHPAYLDARTPPFPHSPPPGSLGSHSPNDMMSSGGQGHHWTFEEQFKQLYEISDDPKRREFLDDLFSFMQKRGTPVNRIPIMAKRVLDLYELFRLVVAKGGLVEVINKKLWREITKELSLPSSITSAAFTLRTQYMKYLYPYECEKMKLSSPGELQAAIDGNRREGRRPSYGYDFSPVPTMLPTCTPPGPPHLNGGLFNGRPGTTGSSSPDEAHMPSPPAHPLRTLAERDARAMEAAQRAMENATKRFEEANRMTGVGMMPTIPTSLSINALPTKTDEPPPPKRPTLEAEQRLLAHMGMPNAHLKITSRSLTQGLLSPFLGDGRAEFDNSLVVSMEINGIMYQGVLFAQHPRRI